MLFIIKTYLNLEGLLSVVEKQYGDVQNVQLVFARELRSTDIVCATGAAKCAPGNALDHRHRRFVTEQPDSYQQVNAQALRAVSHCLQSKLATPVPQLTLRCELVNHAVVPSLGERDLQ